MMSAASRLELSYAPDSDFEIEAPPGKTYLPYQRAAVEYALGIRHVLIADPPGLGKTIEAIAIINTDESIRRVLIACPAYLKQNWHRELDKWLVPDLTFGIADAEYIEREQVGVFSKGKNAGKPRYRVKARHKDYWPDTDIVIVNYEILKRFPEKLQEIEWDLLITDEGHYISNKKADRSKHIWGFNPKRQKGKHREGKEVKPLRYRRWVVTTGTPIMTHPIDLWPFLERFDPQGLGRNYVSYIRKYCGAVRNGFGWEIGTPSDAALEELQQRMRAVFMIRRDKREVLKDLPDKTRQIIPLPKAGLAELADEELDAVETGLRFWEERLGIKKPEKEAWTWANLAEALEAKFGHLGGLSYEDAVEHLKPDEKPVFEALSVARRRLALAKVPMVVEHVGGLIQAGEKVIVFAVHKEVCEAVAKGLEAYQARPVVITGSTPANRRQGLVDRFQDDASCRAAVGNMLAMGTGYTMTEARFVVFAELSWVPSELEQAEDRAWRLGQKNAVVSQHLVVEDSLEGHMAGIIVERMEVISKALDRRPVNSA